MILGIGIFQNPKLGIIVILVYASKPLFTSFGVGLLKKLIDRKPLVLDIDDWQVGILQDRRNAHVLLTKIMRVVAVFRYPNLYLFFYIYTVLLEKLNWAANEMTVSSRFLQKKFGGTIVPHGRDAHFLDPAKYDALTLQKKFNISKKRVITFPHTTTLQRC